MTGRGRPASIRYYFDADVLGLAHIICALRPDCTYPGDPGATVRGRSRPACPITDAGTKDPDWIPLVAARGWLVIGRDRHIARRPLEVAAVREHSARMTVITSDTAMGKFEQLEVVMSQWRRLEAMADEPGPFIYAITRTSDRRLV